MGHVQFREFQDRELLRANLAAILSELESTGRVPFLHFECHGMPGGLELAGGDVVTWSELVEFLLPISIGSRLNLFVSFASCFGHNLAAVVDPSKPAPFCGLIGARTEEKAGFLSDFYLTFFAALLADGDLDAALGLAGGVPPSEPGPMVLWPMDYFFAHAFAGYLRQFGSREQVKNRAKRLAKTVQKRDGLPRSARRELTANIRRDLGDHQKQFNRLVRRFLMIDQFPENAARFQLDWTAMKRIYLAT